MNLQQFTISIFYTDTENLWWTTERDRTSFDGTLQEAKAEGTKLLRQRTDRKLLPYEKIGDTYCQIDDGKGGFSVAIEEAT